MRSAGMSEEWCPFNHLLVSLRVPILRRARIFCGRLIDSFPVDGVISMAMQGRGNAINVLDVLASALVATLLLQTGAEAKNTTWAAPKTGTIRRSPTWATTTSGPPSKRSSRVTL